MGLPEVFGDADFKIMTASTRMSGCVECPKGQHVPSTWIHSRHQAYRTETTGGWQWSPHPSCYIVTHRRMPPDIKALLSSRMEINGGDLWLAKGSVTFPIAFKYNPFPKIPMVKCGNAFCLDNADAVLLHKMYGNYELKPAWNEQAVVRIKRFFLISFIWQLRSWCGRVGLGDDRRGGLIKIVPNRSCGASMLVR